MDPNFIRPTMASYFADRPRRATHVLAPDQNESSRRVVTSPSRRSLVTRARQAARARLIILGGHLSGAPRLAYTDSAILGAAHMPATSWDTDDAQEAAGLAAK